MAELQTSEAPVAAGAVGCCGPGDTLEPRAAAGGGQPGPLHWLASQAPVPKLAPPLTVGMFTLLIFNFFVLLFPYLEIGVEMAAP